MIFCKPENETREAKYRIKDAALYSAFSVGYFISLKGYVCLLQIKVISVVFLQNLKNSSRKTTSVNSSSSEYNVGKGEHGDLVAPSGELKYNNEYPGTRFLKKTLVSHIGLKNVFANFIQQMCS